MALKFCYGCMREIAEGESVCPVCGYRHGQEKTPDFALKPGALLQNGKFFVGRVLGRGGFGITYIGRDLTLDLNVAIKEYYPTGQVMRNQGNTSLYWDTSVADAQAGKDSFLKEAKKMAKLHYIPNIVQVREVFYENNTAYIVMDYVDGETLKNILKQNGLMKPEDCIDLLTPIIRSLGEAHAMGMIHRDVSPDNIMIDRMGKPWLLDMGAAKDLDNSGGHSQSSQGVIKRGFSPPEQYTDRKRVGTWSDVYAMCATIYYCLTGRLLPDAMDRMMGDELDFPQTFPPKMRTMLERGLSLKPAERIQTMDELLVSLKQSVTPESTTSAPKPKISETKPAKPSIPTVTAPKPKPPQPKQSRLPMILIALLLCAALGIGGFFLWGDKGDDNIPTDPPEVTTEQSQEPEQAETETSAPTLETATPAPATPTPAPEPSPALASGSFDHISDIVTFGSYEQDNDFTNGPEPIEWIVLDVQKGKSLLISRYALDCQPFNNTRTYIEWDRCTLRTWLNGTFLNEAFSTDEHLFINTTHVDAANAINPSYSTGIGNSTEDKIFLLSINEANSYFASNEERLCVPTEYARSHGCKVYGDEDSCWWWLRTQGGNGNYATYVYGSGGVNDSGSLVYECNGVRPALWINLDDAGNPVTNVEETTLSEPDASGTAYHVGDIVAFGNYEQDNNLNNGREPIEWIVLDVQDGKSLLISRYVIDWKSFNNTRTYIEWDRCTLRTWLNGAFLKEAFTSGEQAFIDTALVDTTIENQGNKSSVGSYKKDRIFLLSINEANSYFASDEERLCVPTEYAKSLGCKVYGKEGSCWWWLRSPGGNGNYAAYVYGNGGINDSGSLVYDFNGVRPAIWVTLP